MEEQWVVDRAKLRELLVQHPTMSMSQLMEATGHCKGWVTKWKKRLQQVSAEDDSVLHSQSRRRKHLPEPFDPQVEAAILYLRDTLPEQLKRVAGAGTILYYLQQDRTLQTAGLRLPKSTGTIWKILDRHQRIHRWPRIEHERIERPAPMTEWEIDFTDVPTVMRQPGGKRLHMVECFNVVDRGTSILVDAIAREDYNQETALLTLHEIFNRQGLPHRLRMDRDTRFVGSWSNSGFPSALVRYLFCLGIGVDVCPPYRPDLKPFVERFNRTLKYECLLVERPGNLEATTKLLQEFQPLYNEQRPHQGISCHNQPPLTAFPPPFNLRSLPEQVDPDTWLIHLHNKHFRRRISQRGTIDIGEYSYYLGRQWHGRAVVIKVDALRHQLHVEMDNKLLKSLKLKGLIGTVLSLNDYLKLICEQARSEIRRLQLMQRRLHLPGV